MPSVPLQSHVPSGALKYTFGQSVFSKATFIRGVSSYTASSTVVLFRTRKSGSFCSSEKSGTSSASGGTPGMGALSASDARPMMALNMNPLLWCRIRHALSHFTSYTSSRAPRSTTVFRMAV